MRARYEAPKRSTSWLVLLLMVITAGAAAWYILFTQRGIDLAYEESAKLEEQTAKSDQKQVEFDDGSVVNVPTLQLFGTNYPWMYVSKSTTLANDYQPRDITVVTVPTAATETPMRLRANVNYHLQELFSRAKQDDISLMVSSAYRSIDDQRKLYDEFVATKGEAMAKQYVLSPGTSEHHTGYAVDVTDASDGCQQNSDKCNLSPLSAAWLAEHATEYGFIIRYPSGKEPITGIAHEPWHLRYVGVTLARQLSKNDMAFDEFVQQVAPGRVH